MRGHMESGKAGMDIWGDRGSRGDRARRGDGSLRMGESNKLEGVRA